MPSIEVVDRGGKKAGTLELDPHVFEAPVRVDLLHAAVRWQLSRRRRGTHSTKNRAAVSGGGAKPWRQKGTGRARQGSIRAPQWAGGGVVFGPVPRSHALRLPKKMRRAALRSALSERFRAGAITVVERIEFEAIRTKAMVEWLAGLGLDGGQSVLIVIEQADPKVELSARNLPWASVLRVEGLNPYDVLRHDRLLLTPGAVATLQARLGTTDEAVQVARA